MIWVKHTLKKNYNIILTTDARLRSRFPQEQYLFWFREPYATIVLVSCENALPFCFREVWVITACLALLKSTTSHYDGGIMSPDIEREFYRLQGDLYSLSRVKFMRLAYLIGYGHEIERSPANSAALSMLPWPKPTIWPALSPTTSADVLAKEKDKSNLLHDQNVILQIKADDSSVETEREALQYTKKGSPA